jgi:DNA-directed RNA polymerase specialized sigma24 family protein
VARIVGRSEGAVKALQRRALLALARQIEREGVS